MYASFRASSVSVRTATRVILYESVRMLVIPGSFLERLCGETLYFDNSVFALNACMVVYACNCRNNGDLTL